MEQKLALRMATAMVHSGHITQKQVPLYTYGFELLFSSTISLLLAFFLACLMGKPFFALLFLLGFVPERIFAGGYHASSHLHCYFAFALSFASCFAAALLLPSSLGLCFFPCLLLLFTALLFAPVEAKNKPLTPYQRQTSRDFTLLFCTIDLLLIGILFRFSIPITPNIMMYFLSKWVLFVFLLCPVIARWLYKSYSFQGGSSS